MDLVAEAASLQRSRPGPQCAIQKLRDSNPEIHAAILAAIPRLGAEVDATSVSELLRRKYGVDIRPAVLNHHKRSLCRSCQTS